MLVQSLCIATVTVVGRYANTSYTIQCIVYMLNIPNISQLHPVSLAQDNYILQKCAHQYQLISM